jgi:citrate synthase
MTNEPVTVAKGLEGVVAEATKLSDVQGEVGRLLYRGYDINDLAEFSTFEETVYLLWYDALPTQAQLDEFRARLAAQRALPAGVIAQMKTYPHDATPMDVLRTVVSLLGVYDTEKGDAVALAPTQALRLTAQMATIAAAWNSVRQNLEPVAPRADLNHAANFLYMLTGEEPDPRAARIMDTALVLHADHSLNASTFVARSIASTLSDLYSAIVGAIAALKGPLHGGANEAVMRTLLQIGSVEGVEPYVEQTLANKGKVMGFGHRVYKANDPRAEYLRKIAREAGEVTRNPLWYEMQEAMRRAVQARKNLPVNVDFYSASVYYALGIPVDLFTPVFAQSRIAGWSAHVLEQYADNRIVRPDALYIGARDLKYIPISERTGQ